SATMAWDGSEREGPDGKSIQMYVVDATDSTFWFEVYYKYAENGNDFWITVRNFGLLRKSLAGSTTPLVREYFNAAEAKMARTRVESFFKRPYEGKVLPHAPFGFAKSRCLGVNFPDGWISVDNTQFRHPCV